MSSKTISLAGEVHISTGSIYTTVDALEAMKCIGLAYGLYSHAEEFRDQRVMLDEGGDHPALVGGRQPPWDSPVGNGPHLDQ